MDQTIELLKASYERLEGLVGEVKDLRYKIKDVQGDIVSLRRSAKDDPQGHQNQDQNQDQNNDQNQDQNNDQNKGQNQGQNQQQGQRDQQQGQGQGGGDLDQRLAGIEERLDYLVEKFVLHDQEIHKLKQKKRQ